MYIPQGFNHLYGIPLIMEVGSLNTKIGFAGKERPDLVAPSVPPSTLSTSRLIATPVKRWSSTSSPPSQRNKAIQKAFSITASSTTGKVSKHSPHSLSAKNYSSILLSILCSTSSHLSPARNTAKNWSSFSSKSTNSMAYSCTRRQSCPPISSDWKARWSWTSELSSHMSCQWWKGSSTARG